MHLRGVSNTMLEKFDSLVKVSLVELVQFGASPEPRIELCKHLLAVSVASDPGKIDTSEAQYRLIGVSEGELLFKVSDLIVHKPEPVLLDIPTNLLDDVSQLEAAPPKKGFFRKLLGR